MSKQSNSTPTIAGLGEVLWDVFPTATRLGGAPTNFACHAADHGAQTWLISAVGNDIPGDNAVRELEALNVQTIHVQRNEYPTGKVTIEIVDGEPEYSILEDVAWDHCEWTRQLATFATSLDAVCFGTLFQRSMKSREATHQLLNATRKDCLLVLDVNLRQSYFSFDTIRLSLQAANVLKLNRDELPVVADASGLQGTEEDLCNELLKKYDLHLVALTCGADGSVLTTRETQNHAIAIPTDVIDTVGAGDAFAAAVTIGWLRGMSLEDIHEFAAAAAAETCGHAGAIRAG